MHRPSPTERPDQASVRGRCWREDPRGEPRLPRLSHIPCPHHRSSSDLRDRGQDGQFVLAAALGRCSLKFDHVSSPGSLYLSLRGGGGQRTAWKRARPGRMLTCQNTPDPSVVNVQIYVAPGQTPVCTSADSVLLHRASQPIGHISRVPGLSLHPRQAEQDMQVNIITKFTTTAAPPPTLVFLATGACSCAIRVWLVLVTNGVGASRAG